METGNSSAKIPLDCGLEHDCLTPARRYYCYVEKPGVVKQAKRKYNKRIRQIVKREVRDGDWE